VKIATIGGSSWLVLTLGLSLFAGCGGSKSASGGGAGMGGAPVDDAGSLVDASGAADVADGGASPQILFTFDPNASGDTYGWQTGAPSSVTLVADDRDPNNPTPGCLEFRAVFPPYDDAGNADNVSTAFEFGDPTSGTKSFAGATRFHFWVKLLSFPAPSLMALQPFIQGGAPDYPGTYSSYNENIPDDQWHEYVVDVAGETYLDRVFQLVVQVAAKPLMAPAADDGGTSGPPVDDAGAAEAATSEEDDAADGAAMSAAAELAPPPLVLHIDYIWVE
jgi:hypothetical protein